MLCFQLAPPITQLYHKRSDSVMNQVAMENIGNNRIRNPKNQLLQIDPLSLWNIHGTMPLRDPL